MFPFKLQVIVYTSSTGRPCDFTCRDAADHQAQLTAEFPPVGQQHLAGLVFQPIRRRTKSVQVTFFTFVSVFLVFLFFFFG